MAFREGQAAEEAVSNPDSAGEVPSDAELARLAAALQEHCLAAKLTVSTAESCTGGLVGHAITSIDGSSGYYAGGAVTYSDRLKAQILGVSAETLSRHGAVSAQTAVAMAEGARRAFETRSRDLDHRDRGTRRRIRGQAGRVSSTSRPRRRPARKSVVSTGPRIATATSA